MLSGYQTENAFDLQAAPGEISSERCMRLIERAVVLAEVVPQQNVLCDFRAAFFARESMMLLLEIAIEMGKYRRAIWRSRLPAEVCVRLRLIPRALSS